MSKIKIEDIRKAAIDNNWVLISDEYTNLNTELIFECNENHRIFLPYNKVRNKWECPVCKKNKLKQNNKILSKPKNTYRVLALDQATHVTGYSIFDNEKLVTSGTFQTELSDEFARLNAIKNWLISMVESWNPDLIGFEDIQFQKFNNQLVGVTTYKTLAHLQGVLVETCFENDWSYKIVAPATWRAHNKVRGKSRVDKKRSMQKLIKEWFDITVNDDESDAIGIGKYLAETKQDSVVMYNWE